MQDKVLSALSNIIRLQILICLSNRDKNVTQLIANCGLSQSAVSQHLGRLRSTGLVTAQRKGKEIFYHLAYPKLAVISDQLINFTKRVSA